MVEVGGAEFVEDFAVEWGEEDFLVDRAARGAVGRYGADGLAVGACLGVCGCVRASVGVCAGID